MPRSIPPPGTTVLAPSRAERLLVVIGLPVLGVLAGWVVLAFHDAWLNLEWVPMRGPASIVDRFVGWAGAWAPVALLGAGLLLGLVLVAVAIHEEARLEISAETVLIECGDVRREHRGADVREVLVEGKDLVLIAGNGTELHRVRTDYGRSRLAEAFRSHGYTWQGRS